MNSALKYCAKAVELAQSIDPHATAPNPRVGCVITLKNEIIATGVHKKFGSVHAERDAIKKLENKNFKDWKKAEIFITLEPCDLFEGKKTPSCTDLLIEKQFKKIWVGMLDPHFQGKNIKKIKANNLIVEILNDKNCEKINPFFKKHIIQKNPFITLKIAQSLDGKITNSEKYITNQTSREKVHQMRSQYTAILTTTETIFKDNPLLDCRFDKNKKSNFPISNPRIIVLGKREIPKYFNLFKVPNRKILFFKTLNDFVNSSDFIKIDSIMTECGETMNTCLLKKKLVDEICFFIAPKIIGNKEKNSFLRQSNQSQFQLKSIESLESDLLFSFFKKA